MLWIILFICQSWMISTSLEPAAVTIGGRGNEKTAYRRHYEGTVQYQIGDYRRAENHFEAAYRLEPGNFYFGLAYAACMARNGQDRKALTILSKLGNLIEKDDDQAMKKNALLLFFRGVIPCYTGNCSGGTRALRRGLHLSQELEDFVLISAFHNALGYSLINNKGSHSRKQDGVARHFHVRKSHLLAALPHFRSAVEHNFHNEVAKQNLQMVSDTLGIPLSYKVLDLPKPKIAQSPLTEDYSYLPDQAFRALSFTDFDEIVLLLDISGSMVMEEVTCMDVDRFTVMKETARYMLNLLPDTLSIGLGTIGGECGRSPKKWIRSDSMSRPDLKVTLEFLNPDGTTPLLEVLFEAPELFSKSTHIRKGILLVSDGANVCRKSGVDICAWARSLPAQGIQLNVLSFLHADLNHAGAFTEYSCLADQTGGEILYMDNLRCSLEYHPFDLANSSQLLLKKLHKMECYGSKIELWGVFPNEG